MTNHFHESKQQFVSVFALIANFTAYSVFNSLSKENAPIVLRSSVGQYASQLPGNLVLYSLRAFFVVAVLSFVALADPQALGICFIIFWCFIALHVVHVNASLSHVIINSGKWYRINAAKATTSIYFASLLMHGWLSPMFASQVQWGMIPFYAHVSRIALFCFCRACRVL